MRSFAAVALLLAASVRAIQITAPTKDQKVDLINSGFKVTWSSVSVDVAKAHLYLLKPVVGNSPVPVDLGEVDIPQGFYSVPPQSSLTAGTGYQFNIQNTQDQNMGILAQSEKFEVTSSDSTPTNTTSANGTAVSGTPAPAETPTNTSTAGDVPPTDTSGSSNSSSNSSGSASPTTSPGSPNGTSPTGGAPSSTKSPSSGAVTGVAAGSLFALVLGAAFTLGA